MLHTDASLITIKTSRKHKTAEVFFHNCSLLKGYDEVECSISLYPYASSLTADSFHFDPYEDYVFDLAEGKRSTYRHMNTKNSQFFGLLLGLLILGYFYLFHSTLLVSVESVVSIFAAYTVGKEIWGDLDVFFQDLTRGWPIRWVENSFYYVRQEFGTFQRFWQFARQKRYGHPVVLPSTIDFILHSNSKTMDMSFARKDLSTLKKNSARILSILFDSVSSKDDEQPYLLIVRIGLVKRFWGMRQVTEIYQSCQQGKIGTVDPDNHWQPDQSLIKKLLMFGRLTWVWQGIQLTAKKILQVQLDDTENSPKRSIDIRHTGLHNA